MSYPSIHTLLTQFRTRYPMASLVSEVLMVHDGNFVVRASVQLGGTTIATGLAAIADVEAAEDRAKVRALEALGIQSSNLFLSTPPTLPTDYESPSRPSLDANLSSMTPGSETSDRPLPTPVPAIPPPMNPELTEPTPMSQHSISQKIMPKAASVAPVTSVAPVVPIVADLYTHANLADEPESEPLSELPIAVENGLPQSAVTSDRPLPPKVEQGDRPKPNLPAHPNPETSIDLSEEIAQIDVEIKRLGWTKKRGSDHLKKTYGKATRRELTPEELFDFLDYLKAQSSAEN